MATDDPIEIVKRALGPYGTGSLAQHIVHTLEAAGWRLVGPDSLPHAYDIVQSGIDRWAAKPHNAKWWRRIDGTPIPNDIKVNIGEAIMEALAAAPRYGDPAGKPASYPECPACGEQHPKHVMCPPHEVRNRGRKYGAPAGREE